MLGEHRVVRRNDKPFDVMRLNTRVKPLTVRRRIGASAEERLDWTLVQYSLAFAESRNLCILESVLANVAEGHKILVLTSHVIHVEMLFRLIQRYHASVSRYAGKQSTYQDAQILVGTTSKCGTGFDQANNPTWDGLRIDLLIDAASTKQAAFHEQKSGRTMRADHPNIVKLVDDNPSIRSHYKVAEQWYVNNKGTIVGEVDWSGTPVHVTLEDFHQHYEAVYQDMLTMLREIDAKNRTKKNAPPPNRWLMHLQGK